MKKQFKFILAALTLMFISFTTNAQFKKTDKFVEGDFSYSKKTGNVRNYAMQFVNTPWIGFLDDDDIIIPNYIQRCMEEINITPSADVISFKLIAAFIADSIFFISSIFKIVI